MSKTVLNYYPQVIKDIKEFKELSKVIDSELVGNEEVGYNRLEKQIGDFVNESYIETASEYGVGRYENIINQNSPANMDLEKRKVLLKSKYFVRTPITIFNLEEYLDISIGHINYVYTLIGYTLSVKLNLATSYMMDIVRNDLRKMIPANIILDVGILYNKHEDLKPYTHAVLATHTHQNIREDRTWL